MSRAERLTPTSQQPVYFSDFAVSFAKHPVTRQLARLTNAESVKQSLRLLLQTDRGEWPFLPNQGSDVRASMFEPSGAFTAEIVTQAVRDCIEICEPRVRIVELGVRVPDDRQSIQIALTFSLVNDPTPIPLSLIIKRPR